MKLTTLATFATAVLVSGCNTALVRPDAITTGSTVMGHPAKALALELSSSIL